MSLSSLFGSVGSLHIGRVCNDFTYDGVDNAETRDKALYMMQLFSRGQSIEGKTAVVGGNRYVVKNGNFEPETSTKLNLLRVSEVVKNHNIKDFSYGIPNGKLKLAWMVPMKGSINIYEKGVKFTSKRETMNINDFGNFDLHIWSATDDQIVEYMSKNWSDKGFAFAGTLLKNFNVTAVIHKEKKFEPEKTCVICLDHEPELLFKPCGHICVCVDCSIPILDNHGLCPLCRTSIEGYDEEF